MLKLIIFFVLLPSGFSFAARPSSSSGGSSGKSFEFRAHYGIYNTDAKDFDTKMDTYLTGVPEVTSPPFLGLDVLYLPSDYILGLRLEASDYKKNTIAAQANSSDSKKIETDLGITRIGLLLGWRPIKIKYGYLGLLAHVMASSVEYKMHATNISTNATEDFTFKGSADTSYGAGLDFGVYVKDRLKAGFEVGYTSFKIKSFTDSDGNTLTSSGQDVTMNLSGLYGKFLVGGEF